MAGWRMRFCWQGIKYALEVIKQPQYDTAMPWTVLFDDAFDAEFAEFSEAVQNELLARARVLAEFGPALGRPHVDTLKGSAHANMKELRFAADNGAWRVAFAFDPNRQAILLVAGDKSGGSERRFYRELIGKADERFSSHLQRQRQ